MRTQQQEHCKDLNVLRNLEMEADIYQDETIKSIKMGDLKMAQSFFQSVLNCSKYAEDYREKVCH